MKKITLFVLLAALLLITGNVAANPGQTNFRAHLSGGEEAPPVATQAQGQAIFKLSTDGNALHYKLIVANLVDTGQAHIHFGMAGINGPVIALLYPDTSSPVLIPGRFNGVLATGTITAEDLIGPMAGQTIADLVIQINAGNTYVNVHTVANPTGEIRGQIR